MKHMITCEVTKIVSNAYQHYPQLTLYVDYLENVPTTARRAYIKATENRNVADTLAYQALVDPVMVDGKKKITIIDAKLGQILGYVTMWQADQEIGAFDAINKAIETEDAMEILEAVEKEMTKRELDLVCNGMWTAKFRREIVLGEYNPYSFTIDADKIVPKAIEYAELMELYDQLGRSIDNEKDAKRRSELVVERFKLILNEALG